MGKNKKKLGYPFRCDICGKFISAKQFENKEILIEYKPENLYDCEAIYHTHKSCMSNNEQLNNQNYEKTKRI